VQSASQKRHKEQVNSAVQRTQQMLFGSITSQCFPNASGLGVLSRTGKVFMFDEAQQAYGVKWDTVTPEQEFLDFFSLSTLMPLLLDDTQKRIAWTIQQLRDAKKNDHAAAAPVERTPSTKKSDTKRREKPISADKASKKRMAEIPTDTLSQQPSKQRKMHKAKKSKEDKEPKTTPSKSTDASKKSPTPKHRTTNGQFTTKSNEGVWPPLADPIPQRDAKRHRKLGLSTLAANIQTATSLSPKDIELRDNHTFKHSLNFGSIRVMSMYSTPSDRYPLAAYRGVSSGGFFEFHTCPNQPLALLTRSNVSVYVPHHVCTIRLCTHLNQTCKVSWTKSPNICFF